jgi:glycerol-3-phosphate cytidylyltransferase-like family protein
MATAYAQSNLMAITTKEPGTVYLDNTRITKYVNSGIMDGWVKKVVTDKERKSKLQSIKKVKKASKKEKAKAKEIKELYKKMSYQYIHIQFDSKNFKYKALESYYYDKDSQLISRDTNSSDWVAVPIDSPEAQIMKNMTDYIQNNIEYVTMK